MKRRIVVNIGIVLVLMLVAFFCYRSGKAYNIILENINLSLDGKEYLAIEALQVTLDGKGESTFLLDGDRLVVTAVGFEHDIRIEVLDDEDIVIESLDTKFSVEDLEGSPSILNVPFFYAKAKGTL